MAPNNSPMLPLPLPVCHLTAHCPERTKVSRAARPASNCLAPLSFRQDVLTALRKQVRKSVRCIRPSDTGDIATQGACPPGTTPKPPITPEVIQAISDKFTIQGIPADGHVLLASSRHTRACTRSMAWASSLPCRPGHTSPPSRMVQDVIIHDLGAPAG